MREEQFVFKPRRSTSFHLARLYETTRNFGAKTLTGAVFLHVAKTFDVVWIDGTLYKRTFINFPSFVAHKSHPTSGSDVRSVLQAGHVISSRHAGWGGSGWIDLPCPLQSVCQRVALTLALRRVGPLRGRDGHHIHVPQAVAARQPPGVITTFNGG